MMVFDTTNFDTRNILSQDECCKELMLKAIDEVFVSDIREEIVGRRERVNRHQYEEMLRTINMQDCDFVECDECFDYDLDDSVFRQIYSKWKASRDSILRG